MRRSYAVSLSEESYHDLELLRRHSGKSRRQIVAEAIAAVSVLWALDEQLRTEREKECRPWRPSEQPSTRPRAS